MHFVKTTKIGVNEWNYFHSNRFLFDRLTPSKQETFIDLIITI
jgi:hypothetical protein